MPAIAVTIVVAVSSNGIIGREGDMPWRLSTDLKRFKALTLGKPVVMGRKTFQSIGRPLPGRANIVISRDENFHADGIDTVASLDAALDLARQRAADAGIDEVCVIGGGEIYRQAMARADRLYVTHVETEVAGDTGFPAIDPALWQAQETEQVPAGERDSFATRFVIYRRNTPKA